MPKPYGVCKLTGQNGALVRSHLIPKAFTRFKDSHAPRIESGIGLRPIRVHDSWYDRNLVTRSGEDILERYDDFAVREFRRLKLVWSGWEGEEPSELDGLEPSFDLPQPFGSWCFRKVTSINPERIRLFALSLLWRAAASEMRAVVNVSLEADRLECLRQMVIRGNPEPMSMFPVTLIQFVTKGALHNQSPTKETKIFPAIDGEEDTESTFFRFYFDGLLIHVHEDMPSARKVSLGDMELARRKNLLFLLDPLRAQHRTIEWIALFWMPRLTTQTFLIEFLDVGQIKRFVLARLRAIQ
ncbi:hypothetical protein [Mesorhizobium sp. CN2-181]|uniref:hypothetical protein n=1 Tax=Mesorhizobium yinganensis TaxID=3157707 RepID=UPI0032B7DBF4